MTHDDPLQVLGVSPEAGDEEIRAAYLRKVKEYPPDRAPLEFEKVREAYETLRDPERRRLSAIVLRDEVTAERRFSGPEPWLAVLKEPRP